jgi:hypothetical protein
MTSTSCAVLDRIDAVGRFLASLAGTAAMDLAKPVQLQALLAAISNADGWSLEAAAVASEKITQFGFWSSADRDSLLAAVVAKSTKDATSHAAADQMSRRCMQDYTALRSYFSLPVDLFSWRGYNVG